MITAQFLKDKYNKEQFKKFRSIKGLLLRLQKCAKAGYNETLVQVSKNTVEDLKLELEKLGFSVAVTNKVVMSISWK